jgi:hypothetical protein
MIGLPVKEDEYGIIRDKKEETDEASEHLV